MVRLTKLLPMVLTAAFVSIWTGYELLIAFSRSIITWDGMVYWLNGQSFLQGRWPLYEFFRPPGLPLALAFTQYLGFTVESTVVWQPIVTGASGMILFLILRRFVREWLASVGTLLYLSTSVVEYWSTSILTHGFGNLFLLCGIYFLTQANPDFKRAIFGALFLTVAVYTRYPLAIVAIPVAVWYLIMHRKIIDFDALLIGAVLPLSPVLLSRPTVIMDTVNEIFGAEVLGEKSVFVASSTQIGTSPMFYAGWLMGNLQLLMIFLGIGIFAVLKIRKSPAFVFGLWLIPYLAVFSIISNRQDRFVFEVAPAIATIVVVGAEYSLRKIGDKRILGTLLIVGIVLLTGFYATNQTIVASSQTPVGFNLNDKSLASTYLEVGYTIKVYSQPGDIVVAENDVPWLSYYSDRYVYLSRTSQLKNGQQLSTYLQTFNPHPTVLVGIPFFGSNMTLLNSQPYLQLMEGVNTTSWGWVYLYQVRLN